MVDTDFGEELTPEELKKLAESKGQADLHEVLTRTPKLNLDDALTAQKKLEDHIETLRTVERENAIDEIHRIAARVGLTVSFGQTEGASKPKQPRKPRKPAANQYRDPDNPGNTWKGTGAKPNWLKEKLVQGASLEDFLIKETNE